VLPGVAGGCETSIPKRLSLLRFAPCCRVLRPRWCQSGVNRCQRCWLQVCGLYKVPAKRRRLEPFKAHYFSSRLFSDLLPSFRQRSLKSTLAFLCTFPQTSTIDSGRDLRDVSSETG
jgi:hypothetical protein